MGNISILPAGPASLSCVGGEAITGNKSSLLARQGPLDQRGRGQEDKMKILGKNNLEIFGPNMLQVDGEEDGQEFKTEKNTELLKNVEVDTVSSVMESVSSSSQVRSEVRSVENCHMFPRLYFHGWESGNSQVVFNSWEEKERRFTERITFP